MKKFRYILVFFCCVIIISYGFIKISSELPNIIKEKSSIKVNYTRRPFDLNIDTNKYIIYINEKMLNNIKDNTIGVFKNFSDKNPIKKMLNK
jgi:hypothetical protein